MKQRTNLKNSLNNYKNKGGNPSFFLILFIYGLFGRNSGNFFTMTDILLQDIYGKLVKRHVCHKKIDTFCKESFFMFLNIFCIQSVEPVPPFLIHMYTKNQYNSHIFLKSILFSSQSFKFHILYVRERDSSV